MKVLRSAVVLAGSVCCAASVWAQVKPVVEASPAQLELTAEVAATNEQGQPAALRISLKNAGNVAVDLPMLEMGCGGEDGGYDLKLDWHPNDTKYPTPGLGCGRGFGDRPSLMTRAQNEWLRLQPGEFITVTESLRSTFGEFRRGTMEYWVEYVPPVLSQQEQSELRQAGYVFPTEKVRTQSRRFRVD